MANTTRPLDLVLLWHMHQPDYREHPVAKTGAGGTADEGEYALPWVYLHALKDYVDMASHLERHPGIRCVVNFVPVLLDQIEDYLRQFDSGKFRDPLLRLLATADLDRMDPHDRALLLVACFRSNHHTMLAPFPRYQRLHDFYTQLTHEGEAALAYLSGAYFSDLLTWYHLAWTGETERRRVPLLTQLMTKGEGYDVADRRALLGYIGQTLRELLPRWKALAERGQVELSATPQTHPLGPLLFDFAAARETLPAAPLPSAHGYPGGRSRFVAHVAAAQASHARRFGQPPAGMWPAEGAISTAVATHLAQAGVRWIASGEGVLKNSLAASGGLDATRAAYRPWRLDAAPGLTLFFRDERLSDLIGFDYAKWHGRDAAQHFVAQLEAIAATAAEDETPVVSVILDGENAWEHYPYNGYYFFNDLYTLLADHPSIRTTTYSALLARPDARSATALPHLAAGSWVYGTLSTWIGDAHKNQAWDLLCAAKQSYDLVLASGRLDAAQTAAAEAQLAVCESSDWFWWFGDYNPAAAVASFDGLFRRNLAALYRLLQLEPPAQLEVAISAGSASATGGSMRRVT